MYAFCASMAVMDFATVLVPPNMLYVHVSTHDYVVTNSKVLVTRHNTDLRGKMTHYSLLRAETNEVVLVSAAIVDKEEMVPAGAVGIVCDIYLGLLLRVKTGTKSPASAVAMVISNVEDRESYDQ